MSTRPKHCRSPVSGVVWTCSGMTVSSENHGPAVDDVCVSIQQLQSLSRRCLEVIRFSQLPGLVMRRYTSLHQNVKMNGRIEASGLIQAPNIEMAAKVIQSTA